MIHYSSTSLYYKVLLQYYFILPSHDSVLQSTTPVLLRTTLIVLQLGGDVMQNIAYNTKTFIFVTVITIPCKTIRKKKNDNKKQDMQKLLEFFYHLKCFFLQKEEMVVDLGGTTLVFFVQ